nr:carboxylesterase family protein [Bacilli bacterium]
WKKPEPVLESKKIYEAYYNAHSPIQTKILSERASLYPQSEDCLYLNVYLNTRNTDKNKPIMVFIHGGSYGWGGTADPLYEGSNFISLHPEVILITIAYRTGIFGFLDLSSLIGGEKYPDAPNLGLLDQIEALRYIQRNGESFGGDIHNVTIFGESAGGGSVSLLPLIKEARGLFHHVIAESGSVALTYSIEECQPLTRKIAELSDIDEADRLAALPLEALIKINEKVNDFNNFPMRDGRLLPLDPYEAYLDKDLAKIDMLYGTNANEMNYWIGELGGLFAYSFGMPLKYKHDISLLNKEDKDYVKTFMKSYKDNKINKISEFYNEIMFRLPAIIQAERHSENKGNCYMYYWEERSNIPHFKACHAVELAYVFNNVDDTIYTGKQADFNLSLKVSNMWVNFAKTGNPSIEKLEWERYDCEKRKTLMISNGNLRMESDPLVRQRILLSPLIKYMINPGYGNINLRLPFFKMIRHLFVSFIRSFNLSFGE